MSGHGRSCTSGSTRCSASTIDYGSTGHDVRFGRLEARLGGRTLGSTSCWGGFDAHEQRMEQWFAQWFALTARELTAMFGGELSGAVV